MARWNLSAAASASLLLNGAALLVFVAGCQTEVPYDEPVASAAGDDLSAQADDPEDAPTEEAPAWPPAEADAGDPADYAEPSAEPPAIEIVAADPTADAAPSVTETPEAESRAPWDAPAEAAPTGEAADFFSGVAEAPAPEASGAANPESLPWNAGPPGDGPRSEAAQKFFGGLGETPATASSPAPAAVAEDAPPAAEAPDDGGFGGFLDDAYAGLLEDSGPDAPAPRPTPKKKRSSLITPAPSPGGSEQASGGLGAASDVLAKLKRPAKKKATPDPADALPEANDAMPWDFDGLPAADPPSLEPEPAVIAGADPEPTDPVIDADPARDAPLPPPLESSTTRSSAGPMPWETAASTPEPATNSLPAKAPTPPAERIVEDLPDPSPFPLTETSDASSDTDNADDLFRDYSPRTASRAATRRLPEIEPLPAVPVRSDNSRHVAWLLGGKLGLARLADAGGATRYEIADWANETERLAEKLAIDAPPASYDGPITDRVLRLLDACAKLGDSVAAEHGPDHAALVEIALKTNALLVLHDQRPELAGPVARAVTAAAGRAALPGYLWRDAVDRLEGADDSAEILDAVTQLHGDIEAYLR